MKLNSSIIFAFIALLMAAIAQIAEAATTITPGELPSLTSIYTRNAGTNQNDLRLGNSQPYLLALSEGTVVNGKTAASGPSTREFQPPLFTGSNAHKFLGLGTVLFAGLTAMAAPDDGCETNCTTTPRQTSGTTHTRLARTTAALAVATLTTGLLVHWDDFYIEDGITDPDNQHMLLGTTGALMMLFAIHKSANSSTQTSHAVIAELGGVAMAVAIKLTW
ncbi:MAG: hypothetical protein WA632_11920 [Gallionella sp.]